MRATTRFGLLLGAGLMVALCFVGAPAPMSVISGRPVAMAFLPLPGWGRVRGDTLDAAMERGDVDRHSVQRLAGRSFRFRDGKSSKPPRNDALRFIWDSMGTRLNQTAASAGEPGSEASLAQARGHLWEAARMGNTDALIALANAHLEGVPVERDTVRAYAFYRAWARLSPDLAAAAMESRYASSLSPAQRAEATATSEEILRACCR